MSGQKHRRSVEEDGKDSYFSNIALKCKTFLFFCISNFYPGPIFRFFGSIQYACLYICTLKYL